MNDQKDGFFTEYVQVNFKKMSGVVSGMNRCCGVGDNNVSWDNWDLN